MVVYFVEVLGTFFLGFILGVVVLFIEKMLWVLVVEHSQFCGVVGCFVFLFLVDLFLSLFGRGVFVWLVVCIGDCDVYVVELWFFIVDVLILNWIVGCVFEEVLVVGSIGYFFELNNIYGVVG